MPNQITSASLRLMIYDQRVGNTACDALCDHFFFCFFFFFLNHFSKFSSASHIHTHSCAWLSLYLSIYIYIIILCCSMRMHKAIILWWLRFPSSIYLTYLAFGTKNKSIAGLAPWLFSFLCQLLSLNISITNSNLGS